MLDLLHPTEKTIGALASMMACCIWPTESPTETQLNKLAKEIKADVCNFRDPTAVLGFGLKVYPADPEKLPAAIYKHAYSSGPPVQQELE
eukprot:970558-Karenia_brevis.AAC.1